MNIYYVKGVAAYHEFSCARMHTRIHDMLSHPSHNICSFVTYMFIFYKLFYQ
jgi:hypothetical protein